MGVLGMCCSVYFEGQGAQAYHWSWTLSRTFNSICVKEIINKLSAANTHTNVQYFLCFQMYFMSLTSLVCVFLGFHQVLDGAGLDVDFFISSPSGQVLYSDYRKSDGVHT